MERMSGMSTVIAFPAERCRPAGRSPRAKARSRVEAQAAGGPVVVILPVVRIERHDQDEDEAGQDSRRSGTFDRNGR